MKRLAKLLLPALLTAAALAGEAQAQVQAQAQYPVKPIKVLVPYAPGGLTDVVARLYAERLRSILGQNVVVENKPGASGIIAIEELGKARPDGYTIMIGNISTNALTPVLLAKKLRLDYERDVRIIAQLADVPVFFLATTTNFPPRTFAEFIAYAKANPGKVRYGSAGIGSYQQINTEILAKRAGLDLVHVPFKGGGAEIIRDLANGDVQVSWFNITNPVGMMKAGRVRALAIAAEHRLVQFPDVPTLNEVGYSGIRASQWVAAFASTAVPVDIVIKLNRAFADAMSTPEMRAAFERGGMIPPRYNTLEDATNWLRDEMASWKRDVQDLGIAVEEER